MNREEEEVEAVVVGVGSLADSANARLTKSSTNKSNSFAITYTTTKLQAWNIRYTHTHKKYVVCVYGIIGGGTARYFPLNTSV